MKLDRELCIGLLKTVSKSGIDVLELYAGGASFMFHRSETAAPAAAENPSEFDRGAVEVLSPVLGLFRISPDIGAPPYVRMGQTVNEDDIICAVDVMDKRHPVRAGVHGLVTRICAMNGELVEYRQRLAVIQPVDERVPEGG